MIALAVAIVSAACAPIEPVSPADPAASEAYRAVGDGELAAGSVDTAIVAYQEAARLDPANASAKRSLATLCDGAGDDGRFDEGVKLLERGEARAAVAIFTKLLENGADPGASLMAGIGLYELGDDDAARAYLVEAEKDPETEKQARLFLGLVALRTGANAEAAARFASIGSASDPRLGVLAEDLLRLSRREGRLVVWLAVDPRYDTNVELTPDTTAAKTPDGALVATAFVSTRPFGDTRGLYASASGQYRQQLSLTDNDLGGATATAGWGFARGSLTGAGEYGVEGYTYGDDPYLLAQRALLLGRWTPGRLSLGASYRARFERYLGDYSGYSGFRHTGSLDGAWRFDDGSSLAASWRASGVFALVPYLGYAETGPWVQGLWRASANVRVGLELGALRRRFVAELVPGPGGPTLAAPHLDWVYDAEAYGEYNLGDHWVLRGSLGAHRSVDKTDSLEAKTSWTALSASVGVAWVGGFF